MTISKSDVTYNNITLNRARELINREIVNLSIELSNSTEGWQDLVADDATLFEATWAWQPHYSRSTALSSPGTRSYLLRGHCSPPQALGIENTGQDIVS